MPLFLRLLAADEDAPGPKIGARIRDGTFAVSRAMSEPVALIGILAIGSLKGQRYSKSRIPRQGVS